MTRFEALVLAAAAYLAIAAGVTWAFDQWGLIASGVVALAFLFFVNVKE